MGYVRSDHSGDRIGAIVRVVRSFYLKLDAEIQAVCRCGRWRGDRRDDPATRMILSDIFIVAVVLIVVAIVTGRTACLIVVARCIAEIVMLDIITFRAGEIVSIVTGWADTISV